jgi:prepilin-type processing-associated H-X9-DG protein
MKKLILSGVAVAVALALIIWPQITLSLAFGWIVFLYHTLPRVTLDGPSVLVGCVALLLFTGGVHAAGRAWRRSAPEEPRWKLRWSLAVVAGVFLLFTAGISLVAIVHQTGWILTSPEPYHVQTIRRNGGGYSPNNLRQIALAVLNYNDTYNGKGPPGGAFTPQGEMLHSWETYCLIFLGYSLSDNDFSLSRIDLTLPWNHSRNERYFKCILPVFTNSALSTPPLLDEQGFGLSHYAANIRVLGPNKDLHLADITDGTANTLLLGEVNANFKPWGHPVNWRDPAKGINRSPYGFGGSPYSGGANFSMADGSVRFVSERISPDVLRALSTPAGGEEMDASILGPSR